MISLWATLWKAHTVGLGRRVAFAGPATVARPTRSKHAGAVAQYGGTPWLVEGEPDRQVSRHMVAGVCRCVPVLDAIAEAGEADLQCVLFRSASCAETARRCRAAYPSVVLEVLHDLRLVQPAAVPLVQGLRQVPVVQRLPRQVSAVTRTKPGGSTYHERDDVVCKQLVDEVGVPLNAGLVDGIVAATEGDYAGPGDREAR